MYLSIYVKSICSHYVLKVIAVTYLKAASLSNRQLWSAANLKIPRALDGSSWRTKWLVQSSTTSWSSIMSPAISSSWTFSLVTLILPVYIKSRRLDNVVPSRLWMTIRSLLASSTSGKDKERHNWRGTWRQRSWRQWWSRRVTQCGNSRIVRSLWFCVKPIFVFPEVQKLPFLCF